MWSETVIKMIITGIGESLYMTLGSSLIGYLFGVPMGVCLAVTDKDGLRPNAPVYKVLDVIANIVRSIPFLILLILIIPFTRLVVGKSYGPTAAIVPLTLAAIPFIARMVESSLKEVDKGVIEAARSMGASDFRIITKVLLVEARTSLINGATIAVGTILGYSAMAGCVGAGGSMGASDFRIITKVLLVEARTSLINGATIAVGTILGYSAMAGCVGAGGLGDIAIRYGYHRWQADIMIVTVILLILLMQLFQVVGTVVANKLDKRK